MKRLIYVSLVLPLMMACVGNGNTDEGGKADSDSVVVTDSAFMTSYGTVGEGTTMHVLEFYCNTDPCDSTGAMIPRTYEYDNNVIGGLEVGDFVAVSETFPIADSVVIMNITSMSHLWQVVGEGNDLYLQLDTNFTATTYGMDKAFDRWMVGPGWVDLIINSVGTHEVYSVELLTTDSLILKNDQSIMRMKRIN